MNGWQSRWLWQRRRTTLHEDRSLPQSSGRRRSTRCTSAHGHRCDLLRGSGQASSRSLGRSGATAPCGALRGTRTRPLACLYWPRCRVTLWTPPRSATSRLRRASPRAGRGNSSEGEGEGVGDRPTRRKRKKRRKRKLPKSFFLALHFWPRSSSTTAVACSRLVSWFRRGSGLCKVGSLCVVPRAVFRRWYWQWYVLAGFAGYDTTSCCVSVYCQCRGDSTGAVLGKVICPSLSCLMLSLRQRGKVWLFRSCISSTVIDIPSVPQRQFLTVQAFQQTTEIPSCCSMVDVPVVRSCRFSGAAVRRPWRSHSGSSLRNRTLSTTLRICQSLVRCSPLEYRILDFSAEMLSGNVPFSALVGSTLDTCLRLSMGLLEEFHTVLDPRISAQCLVRQRILADASDYGGFDGSDCRKLLKFRSCSSSRSSTFPSWCRGRFPWSCCSADHGVSTFAVLERSDRHRAQWTS